MMGNSKRSKPDDMMGAWKDIFHYIGKYKFAFILTLLLSALSSILALLGPYFISEMTDLIQKGLSVEMDIERIRNIGFILIAIYLISGIFTFFENYMMATVSQRCAQMFRMDISRKMNRIPLRYFDQSSKGDVMSRVTNDLFEISELFHHGPEDLVISITKLIGSFTILLTCYINKNVVFLVFNNS